MDTGFEGKRALVTGAGRGIGRDVAKALYKRGAVVYALSKTLQNLESLREECENIQIVCVDLSDWSATRKAVEAVGSIDLLVNNAAIAELDPFLEIKEETLDRIIAVNLKAAINVAQVVASGMKERGCGGSIVNVSSIASLRPLQILGAYSAAKGGLNMISKIMAFELIPYNIRTNTVCPTLVMTDMGKNVMADLVNANPMLEASPMNLIAEMKDCVGAVLYLLSDQAAMVNGTNLAVDGGYCA